jgi:hypothetical protein
MHKELPLSYAPAAPEAWRPRFGAEPSPRGSLGDETCVIDGVGQFIRGRVLLPLIDGPEPHFEWGAWASLSETNFQRSLRLWTTVGRESERPYFGWFSSVIPCYPATFNLKCMVHTGSVGERPTFELEPTDHPLSVEQREGITMVRVVEFACELLHGRL